MGQESRSRLLYRCRRGTRELEHILHQFVAAEYDSLSVPEQHAFALLLEQEDPVLNEWLCLGVRPAHQGLVGIVARILSARSR